MLFSRALGLASAASFAIAMLALAVGIAPMQAYASTQIAASAFHTVVLRNDGTLWASGSNNHGQLGDGTTDERHTPVQVGTGTNWSAVAVGDYHTVAVKNDGTLWAWGKNNFGQLGDGTTDERHTPVQVGAEADWSLVTARTSHTVALKSNGTLWAWGWNSFGQLGDGTTDERHTPVQVGAAADWSAVAAGEFHTVALKSDRTLWAWGWNLFGQLGDGTQINRHTPGQVGAATNWIAVAASAFYTVALKNDGTLWTWGSNAYGQLGNGSTESTLFPTQVGTTSDWAAVTAGAFHTVALKNDSTLWAWGWNSYGQLGDGTTIERHAPVQIGAEANWSAVAAGAYHTAAFKNDGTLWAWGLNGNGQLGDGTTVQHLSPVPGLFDTTPPSMPTGVMATAISSSEIRLSWNASSDNVAVTAYRIYRDGVLIVTLSNVTSFSDTELAAVTAYNYTVAACDAAGRCSGPSAPASATTLDSLAPSIPAGLAAATVSATQINLSWAAATDNVSVTAYQVFRSGAFLATVNAPTTSFSDTNGLLSATAYSYTVAACDAAGNCSGPSAMASGTTLDGVAPSVPTGLAAIVASATQINLSWTAASDNVGVTSYRVYRGVDQIASVTGMSHSDTGLSPSSAYSYTVVACDAAGNCSVPSASAPATTQALPTFGLTVTNTGGGTVTSNPPGISCGTTCSASFSQGAQVTLSANPGAGFSFVGWSGACAGTGSCMVMIDAAKSVTAAFADTQAPAVPTGLAATVVSSSQINLTWTAPSDNVGVTGYTLYRDGLPVATLGNVTGYSDIGLSPSTAYSYTVVACDAVASCSTPSASVSATTQALPSYGLTVTNAGGGTVTSIPVGISCVTTCSASFSQGAQVTLSASPNAGFGFNGWSGACTGAGLCAVTLDAAKSVTAAFSDTQAPAVPTGLTATVVSASQINLAWTAATDNVAVTSYRVYRGGVPVANLGGVTSYSDNGLSASTAYGYAVAACDAAGNCSAPSVLTTATTAQVTQDTAPPVIVVGPSITGITHSAAVVQWQTSEPATSVVNYGIGGLSSAASVPGLVSLHSVVLSGLNAQAVYRVQVVTSDAAGNSASSAQVEFTTRTELDTTPPVIVRGPSVVAIGPNQATVEWVTNEATTGNVAYGTSVALGSAAVSSSTNLTHRVTLTGLAANTRHFVRVAATDLTGNGPIQSSMVDFFTVAAPDITAPMYTSGPMVVNVTDTTLTVQLATDEPARAIITLASGATTRTIQQTDLLSEYNTRIEGLAPSTTYTVTVAVTDGPGNGPRLATPLTVTTRTSPDTLPLEFAESPSVCHRSHQTAMLCWKTNKLADAQVEFGTASSVLNFTETRSTLQSVQAVTLTGLLPDTVYYFSARSADGSGNGVQSGVASFRTELLPDTQPPVFVKAPQVVYASGDRVVIEWETDEPTQAVVEYGETAERKARVFVPGGSTRHQVMLTNLLPNTQYFVRVVARDAAGNTSQMDLP